jgi:serine/threonine-protein kinase HipA
LIECGELLANGKHYENYGIPLEQIERIAPAFRHIDDVSSTDLRKKL